MHAYFYLTKIILTDIFLEFLFTFERDITLFVKLSLKKNFIQILMSSYLLICLYKATLKKYFKIYIFIK